MLLKSSNCSFLTESQLSSLKKLNILTIEQFISHADLESLSRNSKIPLDKLKLTYKFLVGQYASLPQTGVELLQKYIKNIFILKTGCKIIDNLLRGGLYSGELVEIYGESNSGKTRLCLNIAANLLVSLKSTLPNDRIKNNFRILYIDGCNNFCPKLFIKILYGLDQTLSKEEIKQLLQLISVNRCENIFNLLDILSTLEKETKLVKSSQQVCKNEELVSVANKQLIITHLLIIDNFNILFNNLRSSNFELLSHLHYTTRNLKYLCDQLNIATIVVNTTSAEKYTFNQTWDSLPNVRLLLVKTNNEHKIELVKHTRIRSDVSCNFEITEDGLK
jgi:RecA/RadA recombinase